MTVIDLSTERIILDLTAKSVPTSVIVKTTGCSRRTVFNVRSRNGIRSKLKPCCNRGVYKNPPNPSNAENYLKMQNGGQRQQVIEANKDNIDTVENVSPVRSKADVFMEPIEELEDYTKKGEESIARSKKNREKNESVVDMI